MIDKQTNLALIKQLSDANGISGFEDEVLDIIKNWTKDIGTTSRDSLQNLYLESRKTTPGKPVVQLDCHTDEVGFMVKAIRDDGMIEFITIGGWIPTNVPAHRVRVLNRDGRYVPGVVASKPPHFMTESERKAPLEITALVIDIGASSRQEVVETYRIPIAAPVVPDATCTYDETHDILIGKAFDNRLGCASVIATMRELAAEQLAVDIVGAFASQEEVGTRGATVTARKVKPDIAIVFEGCPADDTVVPAYAAQTVVKKGPMLRHIDARMITNPRFQRYALDMAARNGIPVQEAVRAAGATNGAPIHMSNQGVPTIVIGTPVRYAHTHYGMSAYSDFENGVKLAIKIIKSLDRETIASF
jgi:putative aminopeptidase FrvX